MKHTLVAAYEQEQEFMIPVTVASQENIDSDDTLLADMNAGMDTVEGINESVEVLDEEATVLESLRDIVASSEPVMNSVALESVQLHIDQIYNRLGLKKTNQMTFENYSSPNNRRIALESITSGIKKIFETIVAAIRRVMIAISSFFDNMFGSAAQERKRWDSIMTELAKVPAGKQPTSKVLTKKKKEAVATESVALEDVSAGLDQFADLKSKLNVAGSMDYAKLSKSIDDYQDVLLASFQMVVLTEESLSKEQPDLSSAANIIKAVETSKIAMLLKDSYIVKATPHLTQAKGLSADARGMATRSSEMLPGSRIFSVTSLKVDQKDSGLDSTLLYAKTEVKLTTLPSAIASMTASVNTLTTEQMDELLKKTFDIVKAIGDKRPVLNTISFIMGDYVKKIESYSKTIGSMDWDDKETMRKKLDATDEQLREVIAIIKASASIAQMSARILSSSIPRIHSHGIGICRGINDYCRHSLAQYE
jgi:hypothetical protein